MSKISIEGNALGSGTFTIASPNSNSNRTLNLPDASGTMVITGGAQTIEFAAGTVSAPSITTTGDTNTGIFFPAADTIAFTEGGAEAMRIDSSGNALVGTTTAPGSNGGGIAIYRSDYPRLTFRNSTTGDAATDGTEFVLNTGNFEIFNREGAALIFGTSNTERARITSGGEFQIPLTKLTDSSNQQYFVSYLANYGFDVNCSHKTGDLGVTGDPALSYVILCKAYVSTDKNKDMAFGRVYKMRGSTTQGLLNTVYEFMVGSAYQTNSGSGFFSGTNVTGKIVTLTYAGASYIALEMASTSASSIVADIWYGAHSGSPVVPILVDPGSVSGVSTLVTMTYV